MKRVFVAGLGAVSPAGWGVPMMRGAFEEGQSIMPHPITRPGWQKPLMVREVPAPSPRPAYFSHPRFRRVSAITQYAAGAALEALHQAGGANRTPSRLGLVMCVLAGCVQYSQRFYAETLHDPATASPLLFPETVFNAPASHLAALFETPLTTYTLLGDPATFLQGIALASEWLTEGRVEGCLVVGCEETNWVLADVLWQFDRAAVLAGGAGALYLTSSEPEALNVELSHITQPQLYSTRMNRARAARKMRRLLPSGGPDELLCDGLQGRPRTDAAEAAAWNDWPGRRLSPKTLLGEGLMAAGAWQCVLACDALAQGLFPASTVSLVGINQQSIAARFIQVRSR